MRVRDTIGEGRFEVTMHDIAVFIQPFQVHRMSGDIDTFHNTVVQGLRIEGAG